MPRIRQLTPQVVNKIAAGEVIERPASVVKELLENSLDALATRLDVEVVEGGAELIRVTDDGEGMHPDDLPLAVASHATSKLSDADDLFRVRTLGFRGEALASIAEVSRFRIRSRTADQPAGAEIEVAGGVAGAVRPCGCPVGTTVEVRDLFCNTPVRRKFLRQPATEFGHISEQFIKIALAHPRLHMTLKHDDRVVYELPATEKVLERIALFYGGDLAKHLIWVESEHEGVRVWGYVAHPSQSKANRKGQFLFLNGRWIQDRSLQHALSEAYRGLLMTGRNPISFLFLEMSPEYVDVNVHPTKAEVRFRDGQRLYRHLLSTIRNRFLGLDLNSELTVPARPAFALQPAGRRADPERQRQVEHDLVAWVQEQTKDWGLPGYEPVYPPLPDEDQTAALTSRRSEFEAAAPEADVVEAGGRILRSDLPHADSVGDSSSEAVSAPLFPGPRAIQIHDAYLVVESEDGLTVVDQHALHERILYEQFRKRVLAGTVESQRLLVPQLVELAPAEAQLLHDHADVLDQFGLRLEEFGANTALLTAYPVLLRRVDPVQLVRHVAERLAESAKEPDRRELLDSLLHLLACKAAIKAGQRLTADEIESLLAQRNLIDDAHHCPHGRPTALVLSRAELDRQFGRLG
ncbi:MAG: DNA mismatch repair endonuclease MutL [Planctomycetaceae bacterium]